MSLCYFFCAAVCVTNFCEGAVEWEESSGDARGHIRFKLLQLEDKNKNLVSPHKPSSADYRRSFTGYTYCYLPRYSQEFVCSAPLRFQIGLSVRH